MSRRQEALRNKLPRETLLYFPQDQTTGYVKTEAILQKEGEPWPPQVGNSVTVLWSGMEVSGEIIFMDDKRTRILAAQQAYESDPQNAGRFGRPSASTEETQQQPKNAKQKQKKVKQTKEVQKQKALLMSTGPPVPDVPAVFDSSYETITDSSPPSSVYSPSSVSSLSFSAQPSPAKSPSSNSMLARHQPVISPSSAHSAHSKSPSSNSMLARHQPVISPSSAHSVMSTPTRFLTPRRPVSRFRSPYSAISRRSLLFSGMSPSAAELNIHEKLDMLLERVGAIEQFLRNPTVVTNTNSPQPVLSSTITLSESTAVGDESESDDLEADDELVQFCVRTKLRNVSITNFATILVEKLFTEEERYNRNCRGGGPRNKEALDSRKLKLVKRLVFAYFSVPVSEQACMWTKCIRAIDEKLRRPFKARYNRQ